MFHRAEEEFWKKPSLCSVSISVMVSSLSPLKDPSLGFLGHADLLLSRAVLCHLQPGLSAWKGPERTSCSYSSELPEFPIMTNTCH